MPESIKKVTVLATVITAASSIGVATLLLLTGLIPTAITTLAALNGVTEVDDTLQGTSDDDNINALADSPIELGTWYEFLFFEAGSFATGCPEGDAPVRCIPSSGTPTTLAPNPPWTFEAPASGVEFKVTDAFSSGDQFEVFDFGTSIGTTSSPIDGGSCGDDPVPCFSDPNYSHGTFGLDAGSHSITIKVIQSPFGMGAAYFIAEEAAPLSPAQAIDELISTVENLEDVPQSVKTSLTAALERASIILNDDNPNNDESACDGLDAFIGRVNAYEGRGILTEDQADELRTQAEDIIMNQLDC
jgi:hypothetical protein